MTARRLAGGLPAFSTVFAVVLSFGLTPALGGDVVPSLTESDLLAAAPGAPTLASVIEATDPGDPFGGFLAAGLPGSSSARAAPRSLSWSLVPAAADAQSGPPAETLLDGERALGASLAELVAQGPEAPDDAALLPGWGMAKLESLKFDVADLLTRLRAGLFGADEAVEEGAERVAEAVPAAPPPAPEPKVVAVEPAAEVVALATPSGMDPEQAVEAPQQETVLGRVAQEPASAAPTLEEPASAAPTPEELAGRAPRILGVVNMTKLFRTEPAPDFKVVTVTPGTLDSVIKQAPSAKAADDAPEPVETTPAAPSLDLAALVPAVPKDEPKTVTRVRPTPPGRSLRPFSAAAHGIRVIPGSSAASLAYMLEDVSTRPASAGFGPALTAAERRTTLDRVVAKRVTGMPGTRRLPHRAAGATLPRPSNLGFVLATEGATLR